MDSLWKLQYSEDSVDHTYPVRREADSVSENSPSTSPKKKPKSLSKRRRRKGRGRPKKKVCLSRLMNQTGYLMNWPPLLDSLSKGRNNLLQVCYYIL